MRTLPRYHFYSKAKQALVHVIFDNKDVLISSFINAEEKSIGVKAD